MEEYMFIALRYNKILVGEIDGYLIRNKYK
jgi:hypothetical protein